MKAIILVDCTAGDVVKILESLEVKGKIKIQGIDDGEPIDPNTGQSIGTPTPNQLPPAP